jgi:hypothetical protein
LRHGRSITPADLRAFFSGGEWCCFNVNGLDWISVNGDAWRTGAESERHSDRMVDVDISS